MLRTHRHCCDMMTDNVNRRCGQGHDVFECPDNLIEYRESNVYGLIVHDGGTSSVAIGYCPWCGTELTDSKRFLDELLSEDGPGTPARTIDV
jgi:hypothetical protein